MPFQSQKISNFFSRKKAEAEEQKRCEEESARLHQAEMEDKLPPEPPAGKDISTLRFRFPDGSTKSRRFKQTAKLSVLFIYIGSEGFAEVRLSPFLEVFLIEHIRMKNS